MASTTRTVRMEAATVQAIELQQRTRERSTDSEYKDWIPPTWISDESRPVIQAALTLHSGYGVAVLLGVKDRIVRMAADASR